MIFIDGKIIASQEATCPIWDRSFLCGDGVYTTILVEDRKIFFLEDHIKKLLEGVEYLKLAPLSIFASQVHDFLGHCNLDERRWSLKIIYAAKKGSERILLKERPASLIMIIEQAALRPEKSLHLGIYPDVMQHPLAKLKSLAHLARYFVMDYAQSHGFDDAVTFDAKDRVLECAFGNIFWIEDRNFYTPCPSLSLFFGVTIERCILIAKKIGLKIVYEKKALSEIGPLAFLFRCNSLSRVCAVQKLATRDFPLSPLWVELFNKELQIGESLQEKQLV